MIHTKSSTLAAKPHHFINQIQLVFRYNRALILLHDNLRPCHILRIIVFEVGADAGWLFDETRFLYDLVRVERAEHVLLKNVVRFAVVLVL